MTLSILFCLLLLQYLPKHLHIMCVDMPGHEGTTRTNTDDYSIQGQVKRIHQVHQIEFLKYVGIFVRCLNYSSETLVLSFVLLSLWKPSA